MITTVQQTNGINERLAEKLMGWCVHDVNFIDRNKSGEHILEKAQCRKCQQLLTPSQASWIFDWRPTDNVVAANQVLEMLQEQPEVTGLRMLAELKDGQWLWQFEIRKTDGVIASSSARHTQAISEAADLFVAAREIRAVEITGEEPA